MKPILISSALLFFVSFLQPGTALWAGTVQDAMAAYEQGNFEEALSGFTEAQVESPDDPKIAFNRSSALFQTGNYEEAARGFEQVLTRTSDPALREKALYNLGNTAYRKGDLNAAADAYRKALDIDPSDLEAKQNLEFVLKKIQEQKQQQQEKDRTGEDNKEGNKNDSSPRDKEKSSHDEESASDRKQQQTEQKDQQTAENQQEKQAEGSQDQKQEQEDLGKGEIQEARPPEQEESEGAQEARSRPGEPMGVSKEEAERLLNSLSDDQREFFKAQAQSMAPRQKSGDKDW